VRGTSGRRPGAGLPFPAGGFDACEDVYGVGKGQIGGGVLEVKRAESAEAVAALVEGGAGLRGEGLVGVESGVEGEIERLSAVGGSPGEAADSGELQERGVLAELAQGEQFAAAERAAGGGGEAREGDHWRGGGIDGGVTAEVVGIVGKLERAKQGDA